MATRNRTFSGYIVPVCISLAVHCSLHAAELSADNTLILGNEDDSFANEAEILPVPGGGTVTAIFREPGKHPLYSFSFDNVGLADLVGTLTQTLYPPDDSTMRRSHGEGLVIQDESAGAREFSISVENQALADVIDQIAIASGCNIFLERRTLVIDRCN